MRAGFRNSPLFDFRSPNRYDVATPGKHCMADAIALQISNLSKSFDKAVLHDLSLTIPQGQLYALLGPNGAGKTTTLRIVVGLLKADAGTVHIYGITVPPHLTRLRLGNMPSAKWIDLAPVT